MLVESGYPDAMGQYTQRKRFDHRAEAEGVAAAFDEHQWQVPGIKRTTQVVEQNGGFWLYLTQRGEQITVATPNDPGAVLPDYEFVDYAP